MKNELKQYICKENFVLSEKLMNKCIHNSLNLNWLLICVSSLNICQKKVQSDFQLIRKFYQKTMITSRLELFVLVFGIERQIKRYQIFCYL